MTDNKRIKDCKRRIIAALNDAKIPYAVSELILEISIHALLAESDSKSAQNSGALLRI